MKRSREEEGQTSVHPQPKQPDSAAPFGPDGQKLTPNDALTYLQSIREAFKDNRPKYDEFMGLMKDYKSQRINTLGVIERVKELFQGHPELILGFTNFLPTGYEIKFPLEEPAKKATELKEALSFVNKIKIRFRDEDHIYKSFLDLLNLYRKGEKTLLDVYDQVYALFKNHPYLLADFAFFTPPHTVTPYNIHDGYAKNTMLHDRNRTSTTLNIDMNERANGLANDHGRDSDPGRVLNFEERKLSEQSRNGKEEDPSMQQLPNNAHTIEKEGTFMLCTWMEKL